MRNILFNKKEIVLGAVLIAGMLVSCSDNETVIDYVDGLASLTAAISGPIIVTENSALLLKSEGIRPNDRLFLRSEEDPGVEIPVAWGYSYTGKDESGEYSYDQSQVIVQVDFNDQWTVGKWQLVLQREDERQVISSIDLSVLGLKQEQGVEEAHIDYEDVYKGIIHVYAEGWQGKGIDYYEFVNLENKEVITLDSDVDVSAITSPYQEQLISFDRNTLLTGSYELFVRRWEYNFRQKIGVFDYFKIGFVNQDPITKGSNGEYAFDIYLDKIVPGDVLSVGYGNKGFRETLKADAFDAEKQVYRLLVPSSHVQNVTFNVTLIRNRANLILGSKVLIVSE